MSVTADLEVSYYPFPGYADPSLPAGAWAGAQSVEGDLSGGSRIVDLIFSPAGQPLSSRMYSLEQVSVSDERNNTQAGTLQSLALGKAGALNFDALFMTVDMIAGVSFGSISAKDDAWRSWWLGRSNRNSIAAGLRFTVSNSDGDIIIFAAQGYWWDARSLQAPGGPRRPVGGLFLS